MAKMNRNSMPETGNSMLETGDTIEEVVPQSCLQFRASSISVEYIGVEPMTS